MKPSPFSAQDFKLALFTLSIIPNLFNPKKKKKEKEKEKKGLNLPNWGPKQKYGTSLKKQKGKKQKYGTGVVLSRAYL